MELDQVGNAEACPIVQLPAFQAHFVLTDRGELTLEALGEGPRTELGRDVKKQTDAPTVLLDRIVRHVATTKMKQFRGRGNPS